MRCPSCKTTARAGATHCKQCHAELPPTCAACGEPVKPGEELCSACRTERIPAALGGVDLDALEELTSSHIELEEGAAPDFDLDPDFVGREAILARLVGLVARAAEKRELHFVALTGPPGSGKSRLTVELGERVQGEVASARELIAVCGVSGTAPFAPYARLLALRFGVAERDPSTVVQQKIEKGVAQVLPANRAVEVTHLLAQLLGHPFADSPIVEPLAENPHQLEARTFIAVRRFLAADADRTPLLLVLDAINRASPETVNLTHYLAAGLEGHPVVLLCVGRPDLWDVHPSFGDGDAVLERYELGPLEPAEAEQLLVELCRPIGLPPPEELRRHAREKLGGLPRALFELVRYLLDTGGIHRAHFHEHPTPESEPMAWRFDLDRIKREPLPSTMEELLAARLRAMEPAERDLLEKAAAVGEKFWLDALVALVRGAAQDEANVDGPSLAEIATAGDRTRVEIAAQLVDLERRGLVLESAHSAISGEREYRFAYPPWWDVVYDSLDHDASRRYHRLVAQWLELRPEGRAAEQQEEIARHLERAGDGPAAALRYRRAAEDARAHYYNDKAVRLYTRALACVAPGDVVSRIQLWHDLGSVYQSRGDNDAALDAYERMLRLTWVVASRAKAAVAFNKLGRVYRQKGDLKLALDYIERSLELFRQTGDERGIAGSLDDVGQVLWLLGRYDDALDRSAAALEMRRRFGDKRSIAVSLVNIGNIERHRGLFDEAHACYREALDIRRGLSDRAGIAQGLNGLGMLAFQRGDLDGARASWEEALGIAEDIGALPLQAMLEGHLGELARAVGNPSEARTRFERSEQIAKDVDEKRILAEATRNLGLVALASGNAERGRELCQRALEIAEAANIPVNVGRALVALGEVEAATLFDDAHASQAAAADYFRRGVDLFRKIGNEAELAIALERFGKYSIERGELDAGRQLLTEAEGIFHKLGVDAQRVSQMITDLGL